MFTGPVNVLYIYICIYICCFRALSLLFQKRASFWLWKATKQKRKANSVNLKMTMKRVSMSKCISWWRHQMETFSVLLALCAGTGEFPSRGQWRGALMFSLIGALNKRLSKRSWGWLFATPLRSLWRNFFCYPLRMNKHNNAATHICVFG